MSLPNIPNIDPNITLNSCHSVNLLLSSIAMEEIGLSHILNAEGEKIQKFIKNHHLKSHHYFQINDQVNDLLRSVIKSQLMLQLKLEQVTKIIDSDFFIQCNKKGKCHGCHSCIRCHKPICHNKHCQHCHGKDHCR